MDIDDEEIPDLVEVSNDDDLVRTITSEVDELQVARVPITIITGSY